MICDDTRDEIFRVGHRAFVGGTDEFHWNQIGQLQFDFLVKAGLRPEHVLFDIACGSLRGGRHFVPYLDATNYVGFDKYIELIVMGVSAEIGMEMYRAKRPFFHIDERFNFALAQHAPDYAVAQSLFTHLTEEDILLCLRNLRAVAARPLRFFATFFEVEQRSRPNPAASHAHDAFYFTRAEMEAFAAQAGFEGVYHGAWNHPRGQMMFEFRTA